MRKSAYVVNIPLKISLFCNKNYTKCFIYSIKHISVKSYSILVEVCLIYCCRAKIKTCQVTFPTMLFFLINRKYPTVKPQRKKISWEAIGNYSSEFWHHFVMIFNCIVYLPPGQFFFFLWIVFLIIILLYK